MSLKQGTRVGAIKKARDGVVHLYGWGTYDGHFIPPPEVSEAHAELGVTNPRITLDSGQVVWGMECWWCDEESLRSRFEGWKYVEATLER